MLVSQLYQYGVKELSSAGIDEPEPDVYLLLGHCLHKSRSELLLAAKEQVLEKEKKLFYQLLLRRKKREPVAYILGEREFWSLPFHVSKDVLIPRPETEFLIETVLVHVKESQQLIEPILDICCGSGVIAVVMALELKKKVVAIDISGSAIAMAQKNSKRHHVDQWISFVQGDLLSSFQERSRFSLIVTNPPYVTDHEMNNALPPEVSLFEPHLALDGGQRGLEVIQRLRIQFVEKLVPGGQLFMEIGAGQGMEVKELFCSPYQGSRPFDFVEIIKDYSGRDRVVHCILQG